MLFRSTLTTFQSDSTNMPAIYGGGNSNGESRVLVSGIPVATQGYWSGALAKNGKIYFVPYKATQVLEIDPNTKATTLIGSVYSDSGKWVGAVLAPNGKIYCAPFHATQVLEIDPTTKTTTLIGSVYSGTSKWESICLADNGKLYCAPYKATQVLEIDPENRSTSLVGQNLGDDIQKWRSIVNGKNGKLYLIPGNTGRIMEFNPITKEINYANSINYGVNNFFGAVMANDGKIYFSPHGDLDRLVNFDPLTKISEFISIPGGFSRSVGICLDQNGNLVLGLFNNTYDLQLFDLKTKKLKKIKVNFHDNFINTEYFTDMILAPNGKIYGAPYTSSKIIQIDMLPKTTDFQKYLLLPQNIINQ